MTPIVAERVATDGARDAPAGNPGHRPDATDQTATSGNKEKVMRC